MVPLSFIDINISAWQYLSCIKAAPFYSYQKSDKWLQNTPGYPM